MIFMTDCIILPILYFGHHLGNLISYNTPNCNENVAKMAVKLLQEKGKNNKTECSKAKTCKTLNLKQRTQVMQHLKKSKIQWYMQHLKILK